MRERRHRQRSAETPSAVFVAQQIELVMFSDCTDLAGNVPPEVWNRLGTKILPRLRSGADLRIGLDFSVTVSADAADRLATELRQALQELGIAETLNVQ